ncbi:MAG TPA: radical SAM protein [Deltaproteobacteria bacterium]|nr:radical SAM protein [Deltaproteobacteria bacterium]
MRGRDVLLINPWIYDFAAYDMWAKPLGLLGLGAVLRKNGCRVSFIDCLKTPHPHMKGRVPKVGRGGQGKYYREIVPTPRQIRDMARSYGRYGISTDAFLRDLASVPRPDAVLVTSLMTYWYPGVFEAIRLIRTAFEGVPIILGGIYATLCRDHAVRLSGADCVVSREGEREVLDLLGRIWGTTPEFIPDMEDLDTLPYPLFDLVDPLRYVCIQTSRGCPYRCTYCASHVISPKVRRRNPFKVADEIEYWSRSYAVQDIAFYDDALLFGAGAFALPLMREIIRRDLNIRLHCPNALHARCIGREVAAAMKQSGFSTVRLGLETADPARQARSGAKVTNEEFLRAMENLTHAGFDPRDIGVYILCGLPRQHASEVFEAVRFVKSCGAAPMIAEFSPLPDTEEWEKACSCSRYPLADDPLFQNNTLLPCAWEGLTPDMYREIKAAAREEAPVGQAQRPGGRERSWRLL